MPKCLLCFSENVGEIDPCEFGPTGWGCFECGAFGETGGDISSPAVDNDQAYRHGQVNRVLTDDPEDVFVPGWA